MQQIASQWGKIKAQMAAVNSFRFERSSIFSIAERERRSLGHLSSWNTPPWMHSLITLPPWSCDAYREQSVLMCLSGECDTNPSLSASWHIHPKLSKLWRLFWKPRMSSSSSSSSWQDGSWCSEYSSTTTKLLIWSWIWDQIGILRHSEGNQRSKNVAVSFTSPAKCSLVCAKQDLHVIFTFSVTATLSEVTENACALVAKRTHLIFPPHPYFSHPLFVFICSVLSSIAASTLLDGCKLKRKRCTLSG